MTRAARNPVVRVMPSPATAAPLMVNKRLTPKRPREAPEISDAIRRMMRSLAGRAASGDLQALTELYDLKGDLSVYMAMAALALNQSHGYTWFEIGRAAGMTKQAAHARWGAE